MFLQQGNGHPIAAVITTEAVAQSFYNTGIEYFNTYGGNPVSCAIASAVLDVLEDERLMDHAAELGRYIRSGFEDLAKKHEIIGDVRGVGMFVGVDLVHDRKTREPATKGRYAYPLQCKNVFTVLSHKNVNGQSRFYFIWIPP